ncbi:piggyBac transposable element-derived protein 4 [Poeciliopsis prolifica]|uniref:piggyBac transposable element-derived protein 4 n=1 Tax=Poeciliopsis prolifica TaxID=188132 RepID=UPI00241367D0|nr:piggyBac transposable element-derived protein 4 [Poeciliopsis prolifica]
MRLAESEDELEQLQTDGDSESDSSHSSLDKDYVPRGLGPGSGKKVFTDEESSAAEWNCSPAKRRASKRQCRSVYASPLSSPLTTGSKTWEGRRTCRKKVNNATTPKNHSSSRNSRKRLFSPGRNTQSRKRQRRDLGPDNDGDDGDRWRNIDEEDAEPPQARFRPQRDVGPQLNRTASYTPLELFQLFFTTTVIDTLVRNTNTYGEKKCQGQRESWVPVTAADMYSYICLVLYMGIVPLKTLKEFWRGSTLFSLPFPASVMPCRRFLAISRSLHMNDPTKEAANDQKKGTLGYDRLFKIKPLYEQILEACHTHFHPHQHISIDERMVASKARFGFKQYSRNKPTKWGFKLYVLADSICGYTLNFFVYVGKDGEPTGKGISYDAVMRLLNIPFLGKGYKLYVDNFYTSPALFLDLLKRKIWACGTIRSNIAGYPKEKPNNMPDKTPRGTIRWIRKGNLLFVKWFDTREVTMCTTMHKAYSNDMAKRKVKNKDGQWTVKHVPIPGCVKDYNKHMGGVDLSDALIGYYNVLHKTQRWYKTLFYHFVDIATVNAFILHKEMCKMQNRPTGTQKLFREKLILSLAQIGSTPRRSGPQNLMLSIFPFGMPAVPPMKIKPGALNTVPPSSFSDVVLGSAPFCPVEISQNTSTGEAAVSECDAPGLGHLPAYFFEQMSNVASRNRATAGRRSCVVCKRKSPVYCSTCHKTLCFTTLRNCYSKWHRSNSICV